MDVLLSIKPKYAKLIFSGKKRFEFRKIIFTNRSVSEVYVYVTSPEKRIVGKFTIAGILFDSPNNIWKQTRKYAGITKKDYDEYFAGSKIAYAIEIKEMTLFSEPIDPLEYDDNFRAPQSFIYLDRKKTQQLISNIEMKSEDVKNANQIGKNNSNSGSLWSYIEKTEPNN